MTAEATGGRLTVRASAYLAAAVVAPFASLAFGDPAPVLVVAPVALALAAALSTRRLSEPVLRLDLDIDRTTEGSPLVLRLEVEGEGSLAHVWMDLPSAARILGVTGGRVVGPDGVVVVLERGQAVVEVRLEFRRWGSHSITAQATVPGPLRLTEHTAASDPVTVHVLPDTVTVRRLVEPAMTNMHAGDLVAVGRGAGIEPAEVRVWEPTDPARSINWRASLRSDRLWVTDRHADRNGDLVIVVDSVTERGAEIEGVVGQVVRLVASLIDAYGRRRHRIGLVAMTGYTRWFGLGSGGLHEHRLLEAVMRTQAVEEPVWLALDRVLARTVRRPSLVLVVSPLVSDGIRQRVAGLAAMGIDVGVVAVDPSPWIASPRDPVRALARRIWDLERRRSIDTLRAVGVAVGEWGPDRDLARVTEEMDEWRRRHHRLRT